MTDTQPIQAPEGRDAWRTALEGSKTREVEFTSISGTPLEPLYGPDDVQGTPEDQLGYPGQFPYTRGVHPTMYRGRLWTMRQFAGFGTARETNERFKFLL